MPIDGVDSAWTVASGEIVRTLRTSPKPVYVMKRDISDFFASIDHAVLLGKLKKFIEPGGYLFELLSDSVRFSYQDDGELSR